MLGTLAAFALVKYRRFTGRTLFSGMVSAPLVMPEVIIGLSLLLMLVSVQRAIGIPERGMLTIWFGHLLLGIAYATVVVQARLQDLNPQLEEAAMDLGARPHQVFYLVTLPMIAQSLMSAWLLTFTLSLDDVVLSAFLSGPGSTTMPLVIFSRARLGAEPERQRRRDADRAGRRDRHRRREPGDRTRRAAPPAGHRRGAARRLSSTHCISPTNTNASTRGEPDETLATHRPRPGRRARPRGLAVRRRCGAIERRPAQGDPGAEGPGCRTRGQAEGRRGQAGRLRSGA